VISGVFNVRRFLSQKGFVIAVRLLLAKARPGGIEKVLSDQREWLLCGRTV
jgi:hypothetical protein